MRPVDPHTPVGSQQGGTRVTEELYRSEFGTILHHSEQGILELKWLEASASMTDDEFMRSMERYCGVRRGVPNAKHDR
jgi:hypothetical protein